MNNFFCYFVAKWKAFSAYNPNFQSSHTSVDISALLSWSSCIFLFILIIYMLNSFFKVFTCIQQQNSGVMHKKSVWILRTLTTVKQMEVACKKDQGRLEWSNFIRLLQKPSCLVDVFNVSTMLYYMLLLPSCFQADRLIMSPVQNKRRPSFQLTWKETKEKNTNFGCQREVVWITKITS